MEYTLGISSVRYQVVLEAQEEAIQWLAEHTSQLTKKKNSSNDLTMNLLEN
jgi:hypothetical protein